MSCVLIIFISSASVLVGVVTQSVVMKEDDLMNE